MGRYKNGLLFVGEAPGRTEDALAEPFVGDSGRLLHLMLGEVGITDYYITNIVLCRPVDTHGGNRMPYSEEVLRCTPNVYKIIRHVKPAVVCFIGKVAERFYKAKTGVREFQVVHPAAILRAGGQGTFYYRDAVDKFKQVRRVLHESQTQEA